MRILVIATQIRIPGTGGGETHVTELISHLKEHGSVLALTQRGSRGDGVIGAGLWPGLPPRGLKHVLTAANLTRSLAEVRRFAPQVIYERGSSFGLGALYSRMLGVPMLTMLLDNHMSPLSLRQARTIITTNPSLVPARFRDKAVQVSWGANTQRFHPGVSGAEARRRYGFEETDYVIGYTGTFRPWHGLDVLPDIVERLADPSIKFLLIGELARAEELRERVRKRHLERSFVFTDRVPYDDVPHTLAAADLCIAPFDPTRHRGADPGALAHAANRPVYTLDPLKVFEYLALEKPVLTANTDNIARLFEDRVHLRMVPPRDAEAAARVIRELRTDPEAARRMAAAGRLRVVERHTWSAHAAHLAELFHKMLS